MRTHTLKIYPQLPHKQPLLKTSVINTPPPFQLTLLLIKTFHWILLVFTRFHCFLKVSAVYFINFNWPRSLL